MLTAVFLAAVLPHQQHFPPWSGVHWLSPVGQETGEYQCGLGEVVLRVERLPSVDARFKLTEWTVAGQSIAPDRLDAWNRRLATLTFYQGFSVVCRGDWIMIGMGGFSYDQDTRESRPAKVSVVWGREGAWFTDPETGSYTPF